MQNRFDRGKVGLGRVYGISGLVKENCYKMHCKASKSEDRKLNQAIFCGVKLSIWVGDLYGEWRRPTGNLFNSLHILHLAIFQQVSRLRDIKNGILLCCFRTLLTKEASALYPILFLGSGQYLLFPCFCKIDTLKIA